MNPSSQQVQQKPYQVKSPLVGAWVGLVKRHQDDFNWYGHFTFRPNERIIGLNRKQTTFIHPESAEKGLRRLLHGLNRQIFGVRYWKRPHEGIVAAVAWERQKSGNPHAHVLAGNIPASVRRMDVVDRWFESQGIARVHEYRRDMGAEEYLAKMAYLFKSSKVEIDLLGPWGQFQPAPKV